MITGAGTAISPGFLLILTEFAYLIASVFYGAGTVRRDEQGRKGMLVAGLISAAVGVTLHTCAIGLRCAQTHLMPFTTPPDVLSATGWALTIIFLVFQICPVRDRTVALGALALPLAFLSVFAGSTIRLTHETGSNSRLLDSNLVSLHVVAIVFAFGLLTLAVGCALLYLLQDYMLKRKQITRLLFWRLPPLTTIDNLAFLLVSLAFPLLSIGIIAGIIRAVTLENVLATHWSVDPHTLASAATWAVFGAYLLLHSAFSWRGPRANSLLLVGLVVALVTYFVPTSFHQFG